jgi:hypothetical protein
MSKKPISEDLINNILRLKKIGLSNYAIALKYGISPITVKKYSEKYLDQKSEFIISNRISNSLNIKTNEEYTNGKQKTSSTNNNYQTNELRKMENSLQTNPASLLIKIPNKDINQSLDSKTELSRVSKQLDPIVKDIYDLLFGGFKNYPMKTAYEILKKKYKLTVSLNSFKLYVKKNKEKIISQSASFVADMPRILK